MNTPKYQLPKKILAIEISEPGSADNLVLVERPLPKPEYGELLIRVETAGVNRPDVIQRLGNYPPPKGASDIPGLEIAGTVMALSKQSSRFNIGDSICALTSGGGYAEYCTVPEPQALPFPDGYSAIEAGALPENLFTVWTNLFERGKLRAGERLLVHGGSSGIGTMAIQVANALGVRVFATAGSKEKCQACVNLGAEISWNYHNEDFVQGVKSITNNEGVDVILDMVGGSYIQRNISCLRTEGRLVQIAFLEGHKTEFNFLPIMLKRLTITGSTLRPQSIESKGQIAAVLEKEIWPLLSSRTVCPIIDSTFCLKDASRAHKKMESGTHIGKIMLTT